MIAVVLRCNRAPMRVVKEPVLPCNIGYIARRNGLYCRREKVACNLTLNTTPQRDDIYSMGNVPHSENISQNLS